MWKKEWLQQFPIVSFKAGEEIIGIDEPTNDNYYLTSGICAQIYPTIEGDELVLTYFQSGKMLGMNLHRFGETNPLRFVAKTDCICYKIPQQTVAEQVQKNIQLCYFLLQESLTEQEERANLHIARALGGSLSILCLTLKSLATIHDNNTHIVNSAFTNVELSKYCGIHAVSISRLLTALAQEGVLIRSQEGIIINDMDKLTAHINIGE